MTRLRAGWIRQEWGRQRIWTSGDGPTLLAIHGLGGSGRYFRGLARVAGDHYRIVAPDFAGFGTSDKPDVSYDRGFHLANLDDVLAQLGAPDPIVVVGHSLGGVFAALWAARNPERADALALVASPFPSGDGGHVWVHEPGIPPAARLAIPVLASLVRVLAIPVGMARGFPPGVAADFARQTISSRSRTMWSALHDPTMGAELDRVRSLDGRLPALIVHAKDDRTVPVTANERWSSILPSAERRIVPGGHQFVLRTGFEPLATWLDDLPR